VFDLLDIVLVAECAGRNVFVLDDHAAFTEVELTEKKIDSFTNDEKFVIVEVVVMKLLK
jgi:hypothetical protein